MNTAPTSSTTVPPASLTEPAELVAGGTRIELTAAGDVRAIRTADGLLVNAYLPTAHDTAPGGLFLRRYGVEGGEVEHARLLGARSGASWTAGPSWARWTGEALGVRTAVMLSLAPDGGSWVWRVDLEAIDATDGTSARYDVVAAQDLALAPEGTARSGEAYVSHYLAHRVVEHPTAGSVVATRQTMTCAPALPLAVTAVVEGARAHLTDGFSFAGTEVKGDGVPAALRRREWDSHVRQYELAMPCLLGPVLTLDQPRSLHVVAAVVPDYRGDLEDALDAVPGLLDGAVALAARTEAEHLRAGRERQGRVLARSLLATAPLLPARDLTEDELVALVDGEEPVALERGPDGTLWSYFTGGATHVVARAKELVVERSHGLVLRAGDDVHPTDGALSATTYAAGVFASHVVVGNTNANRLVSVHRSALDLLRSSGVRALVRRPARGDEQGSWQVLGVPSAMVLDLGGMRWVYEGELGRVDVRTTVRADDGGLEVRVEAERGLDVLVTVDLEGAGWLTAPELDGRGLVVTPAPGSEVAAHYPDLTYVIATPTGHLGDDAALFADTRSRGTSPVTVAFDAPVTGGTSGRVLVTGDVRNPRAALDLARQGLDRPLDVNGHLARHREAVAALTNHLRVTSGGRLAELNTLVPWFAQNAMIHFLTPHGLEQFSGAAWGTRDVCQGPLELMLAFGRLDVAREIVLRVLAHQTPQGELPQWFMFDAYAEMYADDAHGDVVVWPLMALVQYLASSGDVALLEEQVPFWDSANRRPGTEPASVAEHLRRTLAYVRSHRAPGTQLLSYGHGDWDDTLQPAQASMNEQMASSWTVALLHQAARAGERLLTGTAHDDLAHELGAEADVIATELEQRLLVDGELAGYVVFPPEGAGERAWPVLHPRDDRTGAHHRLIPMTRSIIAELFTPEQAAAHERLVEENLHFPDGVRLMDAPAPFDEGRTHYFKRAEQSAFFGREVGLMYTHAHIRYAEALAVLGRERLVTELLRVSPVNQTERLASALPRQRNCYYSSSDATFPDRGTAAREFGRLRDGSVGVRGGWRVYSSGPGIYLRQVVQGALGIVERADGVVVDPVLAHEDDGTVVELDVAGERRELRYSVVDGGGPVRVTADGRALEGVELENRYRRGGLLLDAADLAGARVLDITVPVGRDGLPDTAVTARR